MYFGPRPVKLAEGALLAHSRTVGKRRFKKGHRLTAEDVAAFLEAGIDHTTVAELDADDVAENDAAHALAHALAGAHLRAGNAGTGRCNLHAGRDGLFVVDVEAVHRLNSVNEGITLATVAAHERVAERQIAATVKIIPFAVPRAALERCLEIARAPVLRLAPFRELRVTLVQSRLPGLKPELLGKTVDVTRAKLADIGARLVNEIVCDHDQLDIVAAAEAATKRSDVVLALGASAIVDRRDVLGRALDGGIIRFGMPVDPGNLTLFGRMGGVYVIGLPGSARSPRLHGSDYILQRLAAGLEVTSDDIARMGVGGLLKEIPSRPMPRARAAPAPAALPRIAGIILAAGSSSRMGGLNKLLSKIGGVPMIRRVAEAVCGADLFDTVVVTGRDPREIEEALAGLPLRYAHNWHYEKGLSTSLRRGIAALGPDMEAAAVCLGDMPGVSAALIRRLVAAFAPDQGRDIVVPVRAGRRGNPVLIGRRHFAAIKRLKGDVGARALIRSRADSVAEVAVEDDSAFVDLDTPEALAEYRTRAAAASG
jgi:molybdenum cofactor cytidylyltransferase